MNSNRKHRPGNSRTQSEISSQFISIVGSRRLSRSSTNVEGGYNGGPVDNNSLTTIDKLGTAKPTVTYLDKLWTQIDVLDDVKQMSDAIKEKGSFFNNKFSEELNNLKNLHEKLIEVVAYQQFNDNNSFDKQPMRYKSTLSTNIEEEEEETDEQNERDNPQAKARYEKFSQFFEGKKSNKGNNMIFNKHNFEAMNQYVNEVKKSLGDVSESMKKFDDTTKELW